MTLWLTELYWVTQKKYFFFHSSFEMVIIIYFKCDRIDNLECAMERKVQLVLVWFNDLLCFLICTLFSTKVLYTMHLLLWWSILGAASVSFFSNHWLNGVLPSLHARLSKWKLVPLISIEGINKAILYSKSSWQIAEYKRRTTTSITFFLGE